MFYYIVRTLAWVVSNIIFRIHTIGRENLKIDKGFVLCPNHTNALDPVFVIITRYFGKPMWVMAKGELFDNKFLAWFFKNVGVFPVERGKGDKTILNNAIESVKNGRGMLIFPEGTRSKTGQLQPLKSGAFVVAAQAKADIIPCKIIYKGGKLKLFGRVTVIFDKPITLVDMGFEEGYTPAKLRAAKQLLKSRYINIEENNKKYI